MNIKINIKMNIHTDYYELVKICRRNLPDEIDLLKECILTETYGWNLILIDVWTAVASVNNIELMKWLIDNTIIDHESDNDIMDFAIENNHYDMVKLLLADGFEISSRSIEDIVKNNNDDMLQLFIDNSDGLTFSYPNEFDTILTYAINNNNLSMVKSLLDSNANIYEDNDKPLIHSLNKPEMLELLIMRGEYTKFDDDRLGHIPYSIVRKIHDMKKSQ
jgi:ankyrin repeat protein